MRPFFRKEGLRKPTKDGVTLKVQDLHKLQKTDPVAAGGLADRGKHDATGQEIWWRNRLLDLRIWTEAGSRASGYDTAQHSPESGAISQSVGQSGHNNRLNRSTKDIKRRGRLLVKATKRYWFMTWLIWIFGLVTWINDSWCYGVICGRLVFVILSFFCLQIGVPLFVLNHWNGTDIIW